MSKESESLELFHYGIKGMKWGVVKKDSSGDSGSSKTKRKAEKREAKAQNFESKADRYKVRASELKAALDASTRRSDKKAYSELLNDVQKAEARATSDAAAVRAGKMTSLQKKVLVGAAITTAAVATYATYNAAQGGDFNRLAMKGKAFMDGKSKPTWAKNDLLASKDLDANQLKSMIADKINPSYGELGTKMNCRRCTFSYELRRRGYDVEATRTTNARSQTAGGLFNALNPDSKNIGDSRSAVLKRLVKEKYDVESKGARSSPFTDLIAAGSETGKNKIRLSESDKSGSIFSQLSKLPNGSRGELGMVWSAGGGHSMVWEIVKGKPVIFDTQNGEAFAHPVQFKRYADKMKDAGFTRLDNIKLDEDFLMKWAKNAKS